MPARWLRHLRRSGLPRCRAIRHPPLDRVAARDHRRLPRDDPGGIATIEATGSAVAARMPDRCPHTHDITPGTHDVLAASNCPEPSGPTMAGAATTAPVAAYDAGTSPEVVRDGAPGFVRGSPGKRIEAITGVGDLDRVVCRAPGERHVASSAIADGDEGLRGERGGGSKRNRRTASPRGGNTNAVGKSRPRSLASAPLPRPWPCSDPPLPVTRWQ